jgi:Protein of unknown function (DUF3237)
MQGLIPPAGDWLTPVSELLYRLDVRSTLKTDDGELILVEYGGVISTSKESFDRFAKGEVIAAKDMDFITARVSFKRWLLPATGL